MQVQTGTTTETRYRSVQVQTGTQQVQRSRQDPVYSTRMVTRTRQVRVWVSFNDDANGGTAVGGGGAGDLGEYQWVTETYQEQETYISGYQTVTWTETVPVYATVQEAYTVPEASERYQHNILVINNTLGAFALLGLALAAVGLYGVISNLVAQRTAEFGVRLALGAAPADVLRLVLGSGVKLTAAGLDRDIWQFPVVLLADVRSVGVQGDGRSYGHPIVLRPVSSEDAMTADWSRLPFDVLERISTRITNEVPEVNQVVLDITSKPPGTIEWE